MSKALELADAYAGAYFDQALNQRIEDPIPEQKRDALAAELRRLAAVEAAAKNLVKVKGRYHTEQAFKALQDALENNNG